MPLFTHAEQPVIWAKHATVLGLQAEDLPCPPQGSAIFAPDQQTTATVLCRRDAGISTYSIQVKKPDGMAVDAPLDDGAHELLWSPNSKAFFVDGGMSSYSGFFVAVYRLDSAHRLSKSTVTNSAQQDMVISFPPCRAWNRDDDDDACKHIAENPSYNMSAVRWTGNSSAIDVFAEVPCSSVYGGIMCQVKGYELRIDDGRVMRSYSARGIPVLWRNSMAWRMHAPSPPKYGKANVTFPHSPAVIK